MYLGSIGMSALLPLEVQLYNSRQYKTSIALASSLADPRLVSPTIRGAFTMDRRTNGKEHSS